MKIIAVVVVVIVVAVAYIGWRFLRSASDDEHELISLVYLLTKQRSIDDDIVRSWTSEALGTVFDTGNPDAIEFVMEMQVPEDIIKEMKVRPKTWFIKVKEGVFAVNSFPRPYVEEPEEFAKTIPDKRMQKVFSQHKAWFSVDVIGELNGEKEKQQAYQVMGKIMAVAGGDDCLAIFCPEHSWCNEYSPEILEGLKSENPLSQFNMPSMPPVIAVAEDDPRMIAAVAEAKRRWPEFVEAFMENTDTDVIFSIKTEFTEGEKSEFMWVEITRIDGDTIHGVLGNHPNELRNIKLGDEVTVNLADLNDWTYFKNGELIGGFTLEAIAAAAKMTSK